MKKTLLTLFVACTATAVFFSCSKSEKTVPVQILLTDKPASYDEVNVHIKAIRVKLSKDSSSWIDIPSKDTMVNLLNLQNGITTVMAQGNVPDGILKEVRFILGEGNNVVVNGNSYPLVAPSAEDSGLKIKIDKDLGETLNTITLDFDASLSIKQEQDGYKLKPVIKIKD